LAILVYSILKNK